MCRAFQLGVDLYKKQYAFSNIQRVNDVELKRKEFDELTKKISYATSRKYMENVIFHNEKKIDVESLIIKRKMIADKYGFYVAEESENSFSNYDDITKEDIEK